MSFERDLAVVESCHVFRIPPRPSAKGYEASKWFENEIWCGKCRVVEKGDECHIRLENAQTKKLFAKCKYGKGTVENVIDSSRYFVLKIERGGKAAFIGLGFQERAEAFNFKDALGSFDKYKDQEKVAEELSRIPSKDYAMKGGEKIKVNFRLKTKTKIYEKNEFDLGNDQPTKKKKKKKFSLDFAPPPSGSRRRRRKGKQKQDPVPAPESSSSRQEATHEPKKKVEAPKEENLLQFFS